MKVLNLYAGVGGNRKFWEDVDVTAIEIDQRIAEVYSKLYPQDEVIIGDAHDVLLHHYGDFDFIWSSPPCQTHSRMNKATRHKSRRYPDLKLYEEILFLQHFFSGLWVVENVVPYYTPLVNPRARAGRHLLWSNFDVSVNDVPTPTDFINRCNLDGKKALMEWLGIHYEGNIYYGDNHCPAQVLRNCVHPLIGKQIMDQAKKLTAQTQ